MNIFPGHSYSEVIRMGEITCPKCGNKILDHEKFCIGCGLPRPLDGQPLDPGAAPQTAQRGSAGGQNMPPGGQPYCPPVTRPGYSTAPTAKPIGPIVLFAVACVIFVGALVFAAFKFLDTPASAPADKAGRTAAAENPASAPSASDIAASAAAAVATPVAPPHLLLLPRMHPPRP